MQMDCEVCGKPATTNAKIEGAFLSVCSNCASLGQELIPKKVFVPSTTWHFPATPASQMELAEDCGKRAMQARQRTSETVEQLAQKLSINADYLRQIEGGKRKPDERTARKLEIALKIRLFE